MLQSALKIVPASAKQGALSLAAGSAALKPFALSLPGVSGPPQTHSSDFGVNKAPCDPSAHWGVGSTGLRHPLCSPHCHGCWGGETILLLSCNLDGVGSYHVRHPRAKGGIQTTGSCSFKHWLSAKRGTPSKPACSPLISLRNRRCSKWTRARINNLGLADPACTPFSEQNPDTNSTNEQTRNLRKTCRHYPANRVIGLRILAWLTVFLRETVCPSDHFFPDILYAK